MAHLIVVAQSGALSRIVRAQATDYLGYVASPVAIEGLVALLPESDAVLRGAVNRAFAVAGASALPRLQQVLVSDDEHSRLRAIEVLSQSDESAIATALTAAASTDARHRTAGARALGAMQAAAGIDAMPMLACG